MPLNINQPLWRQRSATKRSWRRFTQLRGVAIIVPDRCQATTLRLVVAAVNSATTDINDRLLVGTSAASSTVSIVTASVSLITMTSRTPLPADEQQQSGELINRWVSLCLLLHLAWRPLSYENNCIFRGYFSNATILLFELRHFTLFQTH